MGVKRSKYRRVSDKVTKTARWRSLRWEILRRDDFKCRVCETRQGLEVDHVIPVQEAPSLAFDPENLQVLCKRHHAQKTRVEIFGPRPPERERWHDLVQSTMR